MDAICVKGLSGSPSFVPGAGVRSMSKRFDAIFEGGVFRPLQPLSSPESVRVTLTVAEAGNDDWMDAEFMDACGAREDPTISLEQARAAMSTIRGSMNDAVSQDRGEF